MVFFTDGVDFIQLSGNIVKRKHEDGPILYATHNSER